MKIGSKLRAARQRTGFTQEQVGEAIHVSRQTISNWETGKSLPDVLSVISLSNLYQVSLDELLKGDEKMLRHIDEATNTVKSRQRLGKLVQNLSFLVIWAVCVAVFWLGGGSDAMGFSILVLYGVLPLSTFVVSLLMGLDTSWKERQWGMLLYFGVGFMLMPYGTFSLAICSPLEISVCRSGSTSPMGWFTPCRGCVLVLSSAGGEPAELTPTAVTALCGPLAWCGELPLWHCSVSPYWSGWQCLRSWFFP